VAELVFAAVDPNVDFRVGISDGQRVRPGDDVATVSGSARSILAAERVALNILQRLSGIATLTSDFVRSVEGTNAKIIDTRKTTPGLRILEKYAVRVGGGSNHRFGLDDGILIKDNHVAAAGGVGAAVRAAKSGAPHTLRVEVEVCSLPEIDEALANGADAILLDNMTVDQLRQAVAIIDHRAIVEASGGVNEETVAAIARTGVDLISIGMLTHSFESLDLSLNIELSDSFLE
jgi:nicotinate-nucleotide pyrophosphorylase (carboxylating)